MAAMVHVLTASRSLVAFDASGDEHVDPWHPLAILSLIGFLIGLLTVNLVGLISHTPINDLVNHTLLTVFLSSNASAFSRDSTVSWSSPTTAFRQRTSMLLCTTAYWMFA